MNQKVIALILGSVVLAGVVWYSFLRDRTPESLLQTQDLSGGSVDNEVVAVLLELRAVSLAGTIFSDPVFRSLMDFGTPVIPEPVGRVNPFAPFGEEGTTTKKTP